MAIQLVNVGNSANDGTGDDLREAFVKVNDSMQYLESISFQEGANLGSAGAEIYSNTDSNTLYFRRLVAGTNISLNQQENTIVINNTQPESRFTISGDSGSIIAGANIGYNIVGADAITVQADENTKTITITGSLFDDPAPRLSTHLNANGFSIGSADFVEANVVDALTVLLETIGTAPYQSRLGRYIEDFDGGYINQPITTVLDWIVAQVGIDFGTFANPAQGYVDLGTIT